MKRLITILLVAGVALAAAAIDYDKIERRADRSFRWGEWANASATYTMLAEHHPDLTKPYARAIVSNMLSGDTVRANATLFANAMRHGVALDSLCEGVRAAAFASGHADAYAAFLKSLRTEAPWAARAIDGRLLNWYLYRDNPDQIIAYANIMLQGYPESPQFLAALARGYILKGNTQMALDTWLEVIKHSPDNYQALLSGGNLAADMGQNELAADLLSRAAAMRPSPYLTNRLHKINQQQ